MRSIKKDQGVSKTEAEIEMFVKSRRVQKDFLATDAVCKELSFIGYNFYSYIQIMKKCSYVSKGEKKTRLGGQVQFIFNSDSQMK